MMRSTLLKKYIDAHEVYEIIGHHWWMYIKIILLYILILICLFAIWFVLRDIIGGIQIITYIFGGIGVIIYFSMVYSFFDEYLDVLLITDKGLIQFKREGLRKQSSDILQRVSIESVSDEKNTLRDSVVKKGDIKVRLEETVVIFRDVEQPSSISHTILKYKEKILGRHNYYENESNENQGKYHILVEALGEVVNEYVQKKGIHS